MQESVLKNKSLVFSLNNRVIFIFKMMYDLLESDEKWLELHLFEVDVKLEKNWF